MEIFNMIVLIIAVLASASWGLVYQRSRSLIKNLFELRDKYKAAVADGNITDAERVAIAQEIVEVIDDVTTIWRQVENLIHKLVPFFRKTG